MRGQAKLSAVSSPGRKTSDAAASDAVPYAFGMLARLTAEKSSLYTEAAQQIANDMAAGLSEWLPGFTVDAGPLIEAEPGDELFENPDEYDAASILLEGQRCGTVYCDLPLSMVLVTGLLGGSTMAAGDPRPLTSIDRRVLDLVSATFIEAASSTLLIGPGAAIDRSRDGAFAASDDAAPEARIGFSFRVHGAGGAGEVVLGLELWALQKFSDIIDTRLSGRRAAAPTGINPHVASALQPVPVPFTVGLGRVSLKASEVVGLREGDVIRTRKSVDSDVIASVDNVELFVVRLGQRGRQLTAEILSPLDPSRPFDRSFARTATS